MKKLYVFMLKSFIGPFFATFFISMFVLVMQFLWRMVDELVGKGLDFIIILEFMYYVAITLVPMALPLAVLLSSIMTFGALGENYELVALKASGISLFKIMRPLIILIIILTGLAFVFSNNVMPYANLKMYSMLYDIRKQKPEMSFKEGIFTNDLEGYSIKIDRINKETGVMYNMLIYSHRDRNENYEVTKADSGTMISDAKTNMMELTLFNGHTYTDEGMVDRDKSKTFPFRRIEFDKEIVNIELPSSELERTDESRFSSVNKMLDIVQLEYVIDSLNDYVAKAKYEYKTSLLNKNYLKKWQEHRISAEQTNEYDVKTDRVLSTNNAQLSEIENISKHDEQILDAVVENVVMSDDAVGGKIEASDYTHKSSNVDMPSKDDGAVTLAVMDSIYSSYEIEQKQQIARNAVQYARDVSQRVEQEKFNSGQKQELMIRNEIEWHRKFTLSFACFIFFFIAAPLGAIIRKGGLGMPLILSVLLFIFYYIVSMIGERSAKEAAMSPEVGMWLSAFILMPLGIVLTYQATTDSSLLNSEMYANFFKRLFFISRKQRK